MRIILFFLLIICGPGVQAQTVTVLNSRNQAPVQDVVIHNTDSSLFAVTDLRGRVSLTQFTSGERLIFRHPSFERLELLKTEAGETVLLTEKVIHTEHVVISANKWEQDIDEIPQEIITIEAEEIQFRNPATSADLLAQSGEIYVQKSQLGGGSPSLRGFAANSVLLVFDGVRMNNAIYRSGNLQNVISIDPLALEGVEVLMGPGSVIYGSDALGGVLDFHTVEPAFNTGQGVIFAPEMMLRYGSASNEKTFHGALQAGGRKLASYTSFSFNNYGDLMTGKKLDPDYPGYGEYPFVAGQDASGNDIRLDSDKSLQEPTGYKALSILQKIAWQTSSDLRLTYSFYYNRTDDVPRFDRLFTTDDSGMPDYAEWYYGPQKWMMHSIKAEFTSPTGLYDELRILPAYQHYEESRVDRRFGNDSRRTQLEKLDIFSLNLDADKSITKFTSLFYGAEAVTNSVTSLGYRENINDGTRTETAPRYPDGGSTYTSAAAYASVRHELSPVASLSGGMRYSHIWLNAETNDEDASAVGTRELSLSNGALNGNLGITWKAGSGHILGALLSSGFRAPNVDDVGKVFELDGNDLVIPNADLSPEKAYDAEISWKFSRGALRLETVFFYTYLKDAIVRGRAMINGQDTIYYNGSYYNLYSQVNASKADIYGASFSGSYSFAGNLAVRGTLNYTDGEDKDSGEPLRHTTPLFGSLTATWLIHSVKLEGFVEFNGNRFRSDIPASEIDSKPYLYATHISDPSKDGSPGWYTLNLRGSWQINPAFLFQASLENILDRHYRQYSSGISAPGRNIILSLRVTPGI